MDSLFPDFRSIFESAPGLYLILTPDLRIVAVTDAYLRATMTRREAILGRGIFEVFPDNPDDPAATGVDHLRASLESVRRSGRPDAMSVQKYDVRRPESEGGGFEERYWSPQNSAVLGANGEVRYIIHRVEDVTDFVRLKQAGREREERAQALQDKAGRMASEIFLRSQEVAQANARLKTANGVLADLYDQIADLLSHAGTVPLLPRSFGSEDILSRVTDMIANHRRLEDQLRQSQKMEAVGLLAGGVAHDFNNLLTVIAGYTALLADELDSSYDRSPLDEIQAAVRRAAEMTRQLLTFSRKQVWQPRVLDVNAVVVGMEAMLRRLIGEHILLVTALAGDLGRVKADPGQVEQVIMNLAVNARDAMPRGGKLIIETRAVQLEAGQAPSLAPGRYVVLSVSDNGTGMAPETAARIFEPFFTTKEVGRGTGLGLATALGIAQQSGGTLTVDSTLGRGSIFRCYLPVTTERPEIEIAAGPKGATASLQATLLLVEDETPLRKLIFQVLAGAGHRVLEAANGDEALALCRRHPGEIDLLLTDVVMPGLSGPELVAKLRSARPQVSVLYMSGYDRELMDKKSLEAGASFLPKPFSPAALLERVDRILASRHSSGTDQVQFGS